MKKICLIIFFIFLITFLFFMSKTKNFQDSRKELVFWTLQLSGYSSYINDIISEFEKNNPDIKIKWIDVPYSEGEKRTLAAILTGNPPDLVNLTPDFSLLLAQKNALFYIDKTDLTQYIPETVNALKYDNKYFGIPFYVTSPVTLYNKKLSDKKISTYDELFELPANKKFYVTMINFAENDTLLKFLNKYGINSPESITSEKSINLFSKFKYIYQSGMIPKESITQTHRDSLEKYMSGQLAYLVTGSNFVNMISENAPDVYSSTDVLPQLTGDSGKFDYSLMNFIIPKKSKYPLEAVKFANFFTNEENQLRFAKMTPILPVNIYALNNPYFKEFDTSDLFSKARIISAEQLKNLQPQPKNIKNKKELNTLSSNCIQNILINNADIKKSLYEFKNDWEKL